jgi:hypothetical protein
MDVREGSLRWAVKSGEHKTFWFADPAGPTASFIEESRVNQPGFPVYWTL